MGGGGQIYTDFTETNALVIEIKFNLNELFTVPVIQFHSLHWRNENKIWRMQNEVFQIKKENVNK